MAAGLDPLPPRVAHPAGTMTGLIRLEFWVQLVLLLGLSGLNSGLPENDTANFLNPFSLIMLIIIPNY